MPLWYAPHAARNKAAGLKVIEAEANAEYLSKNLTDSFQSLLLELTKNKSNVDFYEKQVLEEADLMISQATQSYKSGAIDYLDYIQNLNRAVSIRQNYLDALNAYNQTVITIEFITGKTN